jgi:hypothetical protein
VLKTAKGELYHQLIKDEGYRNPMTTPELIDRMRSWLIADYRASIFEDDTGILAYALCKEGPRSRSPAPTIRATP